jgi:hypothetical protein
MGDVSDVVDAVLYLDGAEFVTGEILHVDGGQAAGHHMVQGVSQSENITSDFHDRAISCRRAERQADLSDSERALT